MSDNSSNQAILENASVIGGFTGGFADFASMGFQEAFNDAVTKMDLSNAITNEINVLTRSH